MGKNNVVHTRRRENMNSEIFRVGQTYSFMGYDWTACELINRNPWGMAGLCNATVWQW